MEWNHLESKSMWFYWWQQVNKLKRKPFYLLEEIDIENVCKKIFFLNQIKVLLYRGHTDNLKQANSSKVK